MISRFANPQRFASLARWLTPIFGWGAAITLALGLWQALIASPAEAEHGQTVRIMYVHVPAAWCAMAAYSSIAIASLISFVWRHPLADLAARSLALPGAAFTALALRMKGSTQARSVSELPEQYSISSVRDRFGNFTS